MKPTKVEPTFPSQPAALAGAPVGTLALPKIPSDSGLYTNQNVPPPYPGMEIETKMGGTRTVLVTRPASYAEDDDDEGCDGFDIDENFKLDDAPTSELSALVGTSPPSSSAASSLLPCRYAHKTVGGVGHLEVHIKEPDIQICIQICPEMLEIFEYPAAMSNCLQKSHSSVFDKYTDWAV